MDTLRQDFRFAIRQLRRRPGFTSVAVLTLALGIGATTAIFSVIHAVLIEPLPFEDAHELVTLDQQDAETGFPVSLSIPNYRDWRDRNRSFEYFGAAVTSWDLTLTGRGPAEVLDGCIVIGEFFETLAARAHAGRLIPAEQTEPGADPQVVLAYGFWQRQFGGDTAILGQTLVLDGKPYTAVGVLPQGWGWPSPDQDVYLPMGVLSDLPWDARHSSFGARAIARLLPGMTVEAAQEDMARVTREVMEATPQGAVIPEVRSFTEFFVGSARPRLLALVAGVGFVLLIAVANVANLLLARGEDRRQEVALRTALGASRSGLLRQMLTESLVLAAAGGTLGTILAWLGVGALVSLVRAGVPAQLLDRVDVDPVVLLFSASLVVATALLFGFLPALRASRVHPGHEFMGQVRVTAGRGRLRHALVAGEVALAMVLLIGAGLMIRTLGALQSVEKGFKVEGLLTARLTLPDSYRTQEGRWIGFYERLISELRTSPGVERSVASLLVPLDGRSWEWRAAPEGEPLDGFAPHSFLANIVSEGYFRALGVAILEGRGFAAADRQDSEPVAVVDERMAERFWPGESAVGKRVFLAEFAPGSTSENPIPLYRKVVGVARNVRHYELAEPSRIQAYVPFRQAFDDDGGAELAVLLETIGDPEALVPTLRRQVAALDPDVALHSVRSMQDWVDEELGPSRAMGRLFGLFGVVALVLAGIGIFGVMAYMVAQRTREVAIRMAVGADARRILGTVLGRGVAVSAVGVAVGFAAASLLTRLVRGLLYGVSPFDPVTYLALAALLLGVAATAAYLPARRATRVDPMATLREE